MRCRERNSAISSGHPRKRFRLSSHHRKTSLRPMVHGNGQKMWEEHLAVSGQVTFLMPRKRNTALSCGSKPLVERAPPRESLHESERFSPPLSMTVEDVSFVSAV